MGKERLPMFSVKPILLSIATACTIFYLCFLAPLTAAVSFDFSSFDRQTKVTCSPNQEGICLQGDAFLNQGLQLTKNQLHISLSSSVGRAVYSQPVHIWDSATRRVTDFTTQFSFVIHDVDPRNPSGDGLAFFLSPYPSVIPNNSAGGFLGLLPNSSHRNEHHKLVAIEFDTYANSELDSCSADHIGINVNSIRSIVDLALESGIKKRTMAKLRVEYNASRRILSVSLSMLSYDDASLECNYSLSHALDLTENLPEYVSIGFTAATGSFVETHTILSWSFASNLDVKRVGAAKWSVLLTLMTGATTIGIIVAWLLTWSRRILPGRVEDVSRVTPDNSGEKKDENIIVDAEHIKECRGEELEDNGACTALGEETEQGLVRDEEVNSAGISMVEERTSENNIISSDPGPVVGGLDGGGEENNVDDINAYEECMGEDGEGTNETDIIGEGVLRSDGRGGMDVENISSRTSLAKDEGTSHTEAPVTVDLLDRWSPRELPYDVLVRATNNFSEEMMLGKGGFGPVYRGFLSDLGLDVAIKKLARSSQQGIAEYKAEVKIITQLRHRNLVKLIGWCHDHGELMLVYEFMPNGSLDQHLFRENNLLDWPTRYKVALGLANALMYLHDECEPYVLHRDVKPGNVLLDSRSDAKLADFGLARRFNLDDSSLRVTHPAGTRGYWAPEYAFTCKASRRSDIYSYGVVALQIASGKKAILSIEGEDGERYAMLLVEWVWDLYGKGATLDAADERLSGHFDRLQMERLLMVGLWCAQPDPRKRPSNTRQASNALLFSEATPLPDLPKEVVRWTDPVPSMRMQMARPSPTPASSPATLASMFSDDHSTASLSSQDQGHEVGVLNSSSKTRAHEKRKRWLFPRFTLWSKWRKAWSFGETPDDVHGLRRLVSTIESLLLFDMPALRIATANFSDANLHEQGWFRPVHKGVLPDGQEITVRRVSASSRHAVEELKNEVVLLGKLQHENLVRLLGVCINGGEEYLLVYEYVPNGSLYNIIFAGARPRQLNWERRYRIIVGIARGLQYLHNVSHGKIVHGDVKPSNILLDVDMNPKIWDFGLSRLLHVDQTEGSTSRVTGTNGYMSPEYAMHGHYSDKLDVYSFGVSVLEIITGWKNFLSSVSLQSDVWERWTDGTAHKIVDPALDGQFQMSEVMRCIQVGLLCVQCAPADRPTMASVLHMLSDDSASLLPAPPKPGNFDRQTHEESIPNCLVETITEASITELEPR